MPASPRATPPESNVAPWIDRSGRSRKPVDAAPRRTPAPGMVESMQALERTVAETPPSCPVPALAVYHKFISGFAAAIRKTPSFSVACRRPAADRPPRRSSRGAARHRFFRKPQTSHLQFPYIERNWSPVACRKATVTSEMTSRRLQLSLMRVSGGTHASFNHKKRPAYADLFI